MANFTPLTKFTDSRGWSLNGIYDEYRKIVTARNLEAKCPDDERDPMNFQINYSILYPGIIKAWHRHELQDDFFCILNGMAQVGTFDPETGKNGQIVGGTPKKFFIGEHNPGIVHIPAGEWHGLTAVGDKPCGLLYLVTNKYNPVKPDEERAPFSSFVPRDWWFPENK